MLSGPCCQTNTVMHPSNAPGSSRIVAFLLTHTIVVLALPTDLSDELLQADDHFVTSDWLTLVLPVNR